MDHSPSTNPRAGLQAQARRARDQVATGTLRGKALRDLLLSVPYCERDGWVDQLLGLEEAPPDAADLPRGSVPYLPCGVDEILAMIDDTPIGPDAQLVDLGAGLGRVAMLAHLLSGAAASGIEIQARLVQMAQARCTALGLHQVSFVHGNAAELALDGSVFFLYAPFNGAMLAAVLRQLQQTAHRRPITLCAVAVDLRGVGWLRPREGTSPAISLYDSYPAVTSASS